MAKLIRPVVGAEGKYTLCTTQHTPAAGVGPQVKELVGTNKDLFGTEWLAGVVETKTKPSRNTADLRHDLSEGRKRLLSWAADQNMGVYAGGIHPLAQWQHEEPLDTAHNANIAHVTPFQGRRYIGNGFQVHVSHDLFNKDPDLKVHVMNGVRYYLPFLLALTASSPFWHSEVTECASYRALNLLTGEEPFGGMPHQLINHDEYLEKARLVRDMFPDIKINSDVRFNPRYGTIEFMIMDMTPKLDDLETIAALCQALVATLVQDILSGSKRNFDAWDVQMNRWAAGLYGTKAYRMISLEGGLVCWADALERVLNFVQPAAEEFGTLDVIQRARVIESPAIAMMAIYQDQVKAGEAVQKIMCNIVAQQIDLTAVCD